MSERDASNCRLPTTQPKAVVIPFPLPDERRRQAGGLRVSPSLPSGRVGGTKITSFSERGTPQTQMPGTLGATVH
jgi:hypothetical protein